MEVKSSITKGNYKILHIKDIEQDIGQTEIKGVLIKTLGAQEFFTTSQLRPAWGGTQTITIKTSIEGARKIGTNIKIGWSMCRVQERIEVIKCYRCWSYGLWLKTARE